jgi:hypothetical protein
MITSACNFHWVFVRTVDKQARTGHCGRDDILKARVQCAKVVNIVQISRQPFTESSCSLIQ